VVIIPKLFFLCRRFPLLQLCNGTRLQVKHLRKNIVEATVLTEYAKGEIVFISRILLIPFDYTFEFKCLQFPVKFCFMMMINKTQGQSLEDMGTDLIEECCIFYAIYNLVVYWL
jgi:hypothetical protein